MSRFIEVNNFDTGTTCYINSDNISMICEGRYNTSIIIMNYSDDGIRIKESYNDIKRMIND